MNAILQNIQTKGSARVVTLGIVGIALIFAFAALSFRITSPVLSPLYTNLTIDDSGRIVTELGRMGTEFKVGTSGTQILVKSADVLQIRMMLAQKGLPSQGSIVGYEVFDKDSALGTSTFINNVNLIRALEGELGRTISSISSIKNARVHLAIPKKELFRKGKVEPSASVVITLNNLVKIPKEETSAVKHLVSSAVPGLKSSRVTIIDSTGKILARGSSTEDGEDGDIGAGNTEEFRVSLEKRLRGSIERLLEEAVGIGKIRAQVSAELSFDKITSNSEIFDPDGQVVRSVQTSAEKSTTSSASAAGNVSISEPEGGGATNGDTEESTNEVTNFEISKTITSKISEIGVIKKLSIAVLVDGSYKTELNDKEEEIAVYVPRGDEEIEQLKTLVKTAIGYDESRGDVVEVINMQFSQETNTFMVDEGAFDWLKRDLDSILKTVVLAIIAILVILLVIRPLVNRAFDISSADMETSSATSADMYADVSSEMPMMDMGAMGNEAIDLDIIQTKVDTTSSKKINDLIENNPDETLSVIRSWLSQQT